LSQDQRDRKGLPGVLIDFFKVRPGSVQDEKLCSDIDSNSLIFDHFGEWDYNRISIIFKINDNQRLINDIPHLNVDITNHMSFLAYPIETKWDSAWIQRSDTDPKHWDLGKDITNGKQPLCTMVCIRMHPDGLRDHGLKLEQSFADWVMETAQSRTFGIAGKEERVAPWVLGSFGWKQIIVLVSSKTLIAANQFIKTLISEPFIEQPTTATREKINYATRSISYPLVYHKAYAESEGPFGDWASQSEDFNAKVLFSRRLGLTMPPILFPSEWQNQAELQCFESLKGRFGEYDGEFRFKPKTCLGDIIRAVRFLRGTNSHEYWRDWLATSSVFIEFELEEMDASPKAYFQNNVLEPAFKVKELIEEHKHRKPFQNDRFLAILQRVSNLSNDFQLRPTIAPLETFCSRLIKDLISWPIDEPGGENLSPDQMKSSSSNAILTALEHALSQRTEGINQFVHTAIASAYNSHGSINRLVSVFDSMLKEAGSFAGVNYSGFVVFGLSLRDRYMNHSSIVCMPSSVMHSLHESWTIYHEAYNYLYEILFEEICINQNPQDPALFEKVLPDLITFFYPFALNMDFMSKAYARRFNSQEFSPLEVRKQSDFILSRLGTLELIRFVSQKSLKKTFSNLSSREAFDEAFDGFIHNLNESSEFTGTLAQHANTSEFSENLSRTFDTFYQTLVSAGDKADLQSLYNSTETVSRVKPQIVKNIKDLVRFFRGMALSHNQETSYLHLRNLCYALMLRYLAVRNKSTNNPDIDLAKSLMADIIYAVIKNKFSTYARMSDDSIRMDAFYESFKALLQTAADRSYLQNGG
jgi:hypothetical protein